MAKQSLLPLVVHGSNPVIGKFLYRTFAYSQLYLKTNIQKRRPGMAHLKKVNLSVHVSPKYPQKLVMFWTTFVSKLVNKNFQKSPIWSQWQW